MRDDRLISRRVAEAAHRPVATIDLCARRLRAGLGNVHRFPVVSDDLAVMDQARYLGLDSDAVSMRAGLSRRVNECLQGRQVDGKVGEVAATCLAHWESRWAQGVAIEMSY